MTFSRLGLYFDQLSFRGTPAPPNQNHFQTKYANETYTYDANSGNLASKTGVGSYTYLDPLHVNAVTHINGVQKYWYDPNGNMAVRSEGANTYSLAYDAENRLAEVSGAANVKNAYDGDGKLVRRESYTNLAAGKTPTSDVTLYTPAALTNRDPWANSGDGASGEFASTGSGLHYVQIDLGAAYSVNKIKVWHFALDGRTYHDTKTQVSADGVTWTAVFDSDTSGEYAESAAGKMITFTARQVRYVRDYLNGSTSNTGNHWVEIEVWGAQAASTTTYVGDHYELNGASAVKYYLAGGQRLAVRQGSTLTYLLADHLGSTSTAVGSDGTLVGVKRYTPWGSERYTQGSANTDRLYTGQRKDSIGLYQMGARWYDSTLGRFAQPDSIVPEASQGVQAWDRYAYVNNAPLNFNDPSGHCILLCSAIGAAVGAVVGGAIYATTTFVSGREWNNNALLAAMGTGAIGGGLIGTGVGLTAGAAAFASLGAGTGAIGGQLGYSLTSGKNYDTVEMMLSATASGLAGGVSGGAMGLGVNGMTSSLLNATTNGIVSGGQYVATEYYQGREINWNTAAIQGVTGVAVTGAFDQVFGSSINSYTKKWGDASISNNPASRESLRILAARMARGGLIVEGLEQTVRSSTENFINWLVAPQ